MDYALVRLIGTALYDTEESSQRNLKYGRSHIQGLLRPACNATQKVTFETDQLPIWRGGLI